MRVVICGGGVIGACIAYFLSRRGAEPVVVERTAIACAASGKSGGFLALDWCDGTPLEKLARRSFALHASLPDEIGGEWGYRALTTYGGSAGDEPHVARRGKTLPWLSSDVLLSSRLGSTKTTAQVSPASFTAAMMRAAEAHGAELRHGRVTNMLRRGEGGVDGVAVDGVPLKGDAVVIAMGPWSAIAARWLPLPPVYGLKGHSLIFDTGDAVSPDALFLDYEEARGSSVSPEVFPRNDGTTYVCGVSTEASVPEDPAAVVPDAGAIERLQAICARLSPAFRDARIVARQACHRPVTRDGLPLIGRVPGAEGAYVATGHSVWGILNAPATGEAMADLILDGRAGSVDLSPFAPGRRSAQ
jgi:glycine/D-amino acid oxidase-like deaminating enzyme